MSLHTETERQLLQRLYNQRGEALDRAHETIVNLRVLLQQAEPYLLDIANQNGFHAETCRFLHKQIVEALPDYGAIRDSQIENDE